MANKVTNMGYSVPMSHTPTKTTATQTVVAKIKTWLTENEKSVAWLSRRSGIAYKRVLADLGGRPISLEHTIQYASALGVPMPELVRP